MNFPELNPVELPAAPDVPGWAWWFAFAALATCMAIAVAALRATLRRRPLPPPLVSPRTRALQALAAIPADWSTEKRAAAGARILRGYLSARGFGPGLAYPAAEFDGLRAAESWRELTGLLMTLEALACQPFPCGATLEQALNATGAAISQADDGFPGTKGGPP